MKTKISIIITVVLIISIVSVCGMNTANAEEVKNNSVITNLPKEETKIVYFYVSLCSACDEIADFFDTMEDSYIVEYDGHNVYTDITIKKYNISDSESLEAAKAYFSVYEVPEEEQQVPIVFIGDSYLSGEKVIIPLLVEYIKDGKGIGMEELMVSDKELSGLSGYEVMGVFFTGLVNGLNPCSISMLLFFLSMVMVKSVNILSLGATFILGKLIAYFLLGTLFFNVFLLIDESIFNTFQMIMKAGLLFIVVVIIALNIRDYFAAKSEKYGNIKLQLPKSLRRINHNWIKKISGVENSKLLLLVSFILGMAISVGEFLCTGQIYLATIIYVIQISPVFNIQAMMYFLLYGFALIIPLIILTYAIYKGKEIFDVSDAIRSKYHIIKLINVLVFIVFGIIIVLFF